MIATADNFDLNLGQYRSQQFKDKLPNYQKTLRSRMSVSNGDSSDAHITRVASGLLNHSLNGGAEIYRAYATLVRISNTATCQEVKLQTEEAIKALPNDDPDLTAISNGVLNLIDHLINQKNNPSSATQPPPVKTEALIGRIPIISSKALVAQLPTINPSSRVNSISVKQPQAQTLNDATLNIESDDIDQTQESSDSENNSSVPGLTSIDDSGDSLAANDIVADNPKTSLKTIQNLMSFLIYFGVWARILSTNIEDKPVMMPAPVISYEDDKKRKAGYEFPIDRNEIV